MHALTQRFCFDLNLRLLLTCVLYIYIQYTNVVVFILPHQLCIRDLLFQQFFGVNIGCVHRTVFHLSFLSPEAPTFRPSMDEFSDPIRYLSSYVH